MTTDSTVTPGPFPSATLCRWLKAETLEAILQDAEGCVDLGLTPREAEPIAELLAAAQAELDHRRQQRWDNRHE